jgi:hypothetical protein
MMRVVLFERRDLAWDPKWGDVIHPHARDVLTSWGAREALRERPAFDARCLMLQTRLASCERASHVPAPRLSG